MKKFYLKALIPILIFLGGTATVMAQTTSVSGTIKDGGTGETLAGVNIVVKGRVIGTISNTNGEFNLKISQAPPLTLVFSFIGFRSQEVEIKEENTTGLSITLEEQTLLGQEVVVSASRMEESILQSPVSIEKMDILTVQQTPSDNYYKGLQNLKGVDVSTSSINFQIVNARGFNSTGNTRFIQLTDGMDTQAPALNFPIGNLNGPSELDVESVEFIPGASSALYGPSAFNGALLVKSKSPFEYQGLSAFTKFGLNHVNGGTSNLDNSNGSLNPIGPGYSRPMYEGALRYAKAFNNRLAFKVALSYSRATDWYGTNQRDQNEAQTPAGYDSNPGANRVHVFGDEVSANLSLVGLSLASSLPATLQPFVGYLPNQIVSRTGYEEQHLVDYNAKNLKMNAALHYRITDKIELIGQWNYGSGTSVYTGAQRYSLKDFFINQYKLELKGDNFFVRGYATIENSGDSYIADLTGVLINGGYRPDPTTGVPTLFGWKDNSQWFGQYGGAYLQSLAVQGFNPTLGVDPTTAQQIAAHNFARTAANVGRFVPGTPQFENAKAIARENVIPYGSLFSDDTGLYHAEGQYNFKNQIKFMDLLAGASFRLFDLNSKGTIFADGPGNDITIQEVGAYVQGAKRFLDDKLKVTGSIRYDKNQNFDNQINPRISAVYTIAQKHNLRASFQTGFRNPTTQGQHIDLNVVSARLLGGLPYYAEKYNVFVPGQTYTLASVNNYTNRITQNLDNAAYVAALGGQANAGLALGDPATIDLLTPINSIEPVKPEQVRNIEFGYKGLLGDKFLLDIAYYRNQITDFITQVAVRKSAGVIDQNAPGITEQNVRNGQSLLTPITTPGQENTFSVYTNISDRDISSQGLAMGFEYSLPKGYKLSGNYNWNKLDTELGEEFLFDGFNTPENKLNLGVGNRKVTDRVGFNVNYRWQEKFFWAASFARGEVPSFGTVDAQVSYKLKAMKSVLKIGGSNLMNTRYVMNYGGPTIGAIYYVSLTFDQLMN
jgi:Outer membrane receptor for ferrienterochelin and colicins